MKKFGNFAKVFGLTAVSVAVFVFAIGGCEQLTEMVKVPIAKTVEVRNKAALKEALEGDVKEFTIPVSLNTNHDITVTSEKVITIPTGVMVTLKSLTTQADVTVVGPAAIGGTANRVELVSGDGNNGELEDTGEPDYSEAGVVRIKRHFEVKTTSNFNLTGNAKLAFYPAVTMDSAVVEGTLTAENEDSIFWIAVGEVQVEITRAFSGGGTVQTSSGSEPIGAAETSIREQYIPELSTPDVLYDGGEGYVESEEEEESDPFDDDNYVSVPVTSVTLKNGDSDLTALNLALGNTVQLTAVTDPIDIPVTWFSEKNGVATVEDGQITAVGGGIARIKATAGGKSAICTVTVIVEKTAGLYKIQLVDEESVEAKIDLSGRNEATMLAKAFGYIKDSGSDDGVYLILLETKEQDVAGYTIGTGPTGLSTGSRKNLKITLQGMGGTTVEIQKSSTAGALFTVYGNSANDKPELVLGENITLKGIETNTSPLVVVGNTANTKMGSLTMLEGSKITGNINTKATGGGVQVVQGGTFVMEDGMIDKNETTNNSGVGGGVNVGANGTFTMNGGSIKGNKAGNSSGGTTSKGGGVNVNTNGTFTMNGGTIEDNVTLMKDNYITAAGSVGGGVYVAGTFTMKGNATIKNNTAAASGGGVAVGGTFDIQGGSIEGNGVGNQRTTRFGAAVCVWTNTGVKFTKSGGVIYGNGTAGGDSIPQDKANKAAEGTSVNAIDVIVSSAVSAFRNSTADENTSLDSTKTSENDSGWSIPD
jgi:hypothetical protein